MNRSLHAPHPGPALPTSPRAWALVALLLALHACLAISSLRRNSVTVDEFSHLPAGLTYWQKGSLALYHHNPPLVKLLAALPVLLSDPVVDYDGSWARGIEGGYPPNQVDFATEFMRSNVDRYSDLFNRGRAVIVLLSTVGGLLVFLWARDLWGTGGGLLAMSLWALDPNILAHAGLVTTDVGGTVAIFGAAYAFWRWLRVPSWGRAAVAGIVLGVAQLVKFNALALYLLLPVLAAAYGLAGRHGTARGADRGASQRTLAQGLSIFGASLLVINLGYGFEGTGRPLGGFPFLSVELTRPRTDGVVPHHPHGFYQQIYRDRQNRFQGTWIERLPVPLPAHYLLGLDEQRFESHLGLPGGGFAMYLNGEVRREGWWNYYLYALALKVPISTWILAIAAAVAAWLVPALRAGPIGEIFWILPAVTILAGMCWMTGLDLGVRYVLPVFPFLFVGIGRLARLFDEEGRKALLATGVLTLTLVWNFVETVSIWPHYISYFNEVAGGPAGGHRYLIDSNLDWGQDLLELKRWLRAHPQEEPVGLAYFGAVDPAVFGIRFRLPPRDPRVVRSDLRLPGELDGLRPGLYAVSVNLLQGLSLAVATGDGRTVSADQGAFGYWRDFRPMARAGYSIWIYRLGENDVRRIRRLWNMGAFP